MRRIAGLAEPTAGFSRRILLQSAWQQAGVYCAVRDEPYNIIRINFSLSRVASQAVSVYMWPTHRHLDPNSHSVT